MWKFHSDCVEQKMLHYVSLVAFLIFLFKFVLVSVSKLVWLHPFMTLPGVHSDQSPSSVNILEQAKAYLKIEQQATTFADASVLNQHRKVFRIFCCFLPQGCANSYFPLFGLRCAIWVISAEGEVKQHSKELVLKLFPWSGIVSSLTY